MPRNPSTRTLALIGATAALALGGWCAQAGAATLASARAMAGAAAAGGAVQVTMPPAGLSLEYPIMVEDLGAGPCPPPALVSELERLGSPPLSLGGQSQDFTAPAGAVLPPTVNFEQATTYPLPGTFWSQLHCLLSATKDPLSVGINARIGNLAWAQQIVAGALSAATNGVQFSLGNEPDHYYLPDYASLDKPQAGEETIDVNSYLQVATYLQPALAGGSLIGPELSIPVRWQHQLPRVISTLHEQTVGVHMYPLTTCVTPHAVTLEGILSSHAAEAPRSLAWVVADAGAAGLPAIISEANSASCGGKPGVSDSPAAAVWGARFVLNALKTGFREVRFHFAGDSYDPFVMRGGELLARPLESALVALNEWLPVGSSLQTLSGVKGVVATAVAGTAVAGTASGAQLIYDNEHTRSATVTLRSTRSVRVQELSPAAAGLLARTYRPTHGRVKLTVPANSVLAVLAEA